MLFRKVIPLVVGLFFFVSPIWSADFNTDGKVDFQDFILFAEVFGSAQEDDNFEAKFDLNNNGEVEFTDFTLFTAQFNVAAKASKITSDKPEDILRAEALEAAAKAYRESGDYETAIKTYQAMIEASDLPLYKAKGMYGLGVLYTKIDSFNLAATQFKNILDNWGESEDIKVRDRLLFASLRLAHIKHKQGDIIRRLEYFKKAQSFLPSRR